ncbi:Aste57867_606 [Aphanomyces stellatus]|uniref:Aste57867_606 protein n=1 Tax=Aphanomyces stellatus TaxID=120398 RepID=A0A485K5Q1_9STRA|nr:hypothetical protein As57867_000605 [Aphanomyces stellatus]VFT77831.1 Aste57867_606 [Aphanomyces stellatus]
MNGSLMLHRIFLLLALAFLSVASATSAQPTPKPSTISRPQTIALELSNVRFGARSEAFRVQIAIGDEDLPMRIWLESKKTKQQWACLVIDIEDHKAKGATYVLPTDVIILGLQRGLSALDSSHTLDASGCSVGLGDTKNNHLRLVLELKFLTLLSAKYEFDLAPLETEKIDILEAKIRDIQDELPRITHQSTNNHNGIVAELLSSADTKKYIPWTIKTSPSQHFIKISALKTTVYFLRPGIYLLQASTQAAGGNLVLNVDEEPVWTSGASIWNGARNVLQLSYTIVANKDTSVKLQVLGQSNFVKQGAKLTIILVQHMPDTSHFKYSETCTPDKDCN